MSNRIIGGEYAIEQKTGLTPVQGDTRALYSCGRTALSAVLRQVIPDGIGSVLIPDHICGSVPETISRMGLKCMFYHIGEDFMPDEDSLVSAAHDVNAVLLVNYFGMIPADSADRLISVVRSANNAITVIMDDVQNYYGLGSEKGCDYAFTSLRKWFPVPDGALIVKNTASGQESLYPSVDAGSTPSPLFSRYKFAGNILKNYRDIIGDDICLELIEKGEELIDSDEALTALPYSSLALNELDHASISSRRQHNAAVLHRELCRHDIPHLYSESAVPLFVPIILKKGRDRVRKAMFERSVFCPVHWNDGWQSKFGTPLNPLADMELSLICDQRYDEDDMMYQLEILINECNNL